MTALQLEPVKYARLFSDIHLDFDVPKKNFTFDSLWMPEKLETDRESVLILSGDIWHADKPFSYFGESWMRKVAAQFKYVLVVLGNHDFWSGSFPGEYEAFNKKLKAQEITNVFLLQDNTILMGNVKFVGGTLWTDYMHGDSWCMQEAETGGMKDYKYIRYGQDFRRLRARHLLGAHIATKDYIFKNALKDNLEQKVWVITHHLPSFKSVNEKFHNVQFKYDNALYYSDLDFQIEQSQIDVWTHGHSHQVQDYMIGNTRVLANPRGYRMEDTGYNPWFVIDL